MRLTNSLFLASIAAAVSNGAHASRLDYVQMSGTGCPASSASLVKYEKGDVATLIFDAFNVNTAPGAGRTNTSCEIRLSLSKPDGVAGTRMKVDIRGYAQAPRGVSASLSTSLSSDARIQQVDPAQRVSFSNTANDYRSSARTDFIQPSNYAISIVFQVVLQVSTSSRNTNGRVTVDSIDFSLEDR